MTTTMNRINIIKTRSTATITTTTATVSQPKEAGSRHSHRGAERRFKSCLRQAKKNVHVPFAGKTLVYLRIMLFTRRPLFFLHRAADESQRIAKWDAFIAFLEAHGPSVVKTQGQLGGDPKVGGEDNAIQSI